MSVARRLSQALLVTTAAYAMAHHRGRTSGSTRTERAAALPGDDLVRAPAFVTDHATTIDAPPAAVWPWLVQMGWGRGGWYLPSAVDRWCFPDDPPSADTIHPEWQDLAVGDELLDGPPAIGSSFTVAALEPEHHLVLLSDTHLPVSWSERAGATSRWSWAFHLADLSDGRTRLHVRSRAQLAPGWLAALARLAVTPAELITTTPMLHTVRRLAETHHRVAVLPTAAEQAPLAASG